MDKQLLKLSIFTLCFAISITVNLLDESLIVRCVTFFSGFMSGWGACYSVGCMAGEIKN